MKFLRLVFSISLICLVGAYQKQRQMPPQNLQQLQNRCLTQQLIHNAKDKTCTTQKKVRMQLQNVEDGIFFCLSYKKPIGDVYNAYDIIRISMHHDYDLQYSGANVIDYEMPSFKIYTGNEYNARFAIFSNNTQFRIYFCTINGDAQTCNYGRKANRVWPSGNKTVDDESPSENPSKDDQIEQNQFQPPAEDKREPTTPKVPENSKNSRPLQAQNLPRNFPKETPDEEKEEPSENLEDSDEEEEPIDEENPDPPPSNPKNSKTTKNPKRPQSPRQKKPIVEDEEEKEEPTENVEDSDEEPAPSIPQNPRNVKTTKNPNLNKPPPDAKLNSNKRPQSVRPKKPVEIPEDEEEKEEPTEILEDSDEELPKSLPKIPKSTKNPNLNKLPKSPAPKKPVEIPEEKEYPEENLEESDEEQDPIEYPSPDQKNPKTTKNPNLNKSTPQNSRPKKPNPLIDPPKLPEAPSEDEEDPENIPKEPESSNNEPSVEDENENNPDVPENEPEPETTTQKITTTPTPPKVTRKPSRRPQKFKNPQRNSPKSPQNITTTTQAPVQVDNPPQDPILPENPPQDPILPENPTDPPQEEKLPEQPVKNDLTCGTIQKMVDLKDFSMPTNPGQYPFTASINQIIDGDENNQVYKCSGSIVEKSVILTSVNCLMDCNGRLLKTDELKVHVGQYSKNMRGPKSKTFDVDQILPHEQYNSKLDNNIAAIKLKQNIEYDDYVQPICLPDKNTPMKLKEGDVGKLAGYDKSGLLKDSDYKINFNDEVEVLNQEPKDPSTCPSFNGENTSNDIDATSLGCGLYMNNPVAPQQWILIGITSNKPHALSSNRNAAFTNVVFYGDWIDKCLQILG